MKFNKIFDEYLELAKPVKTLINWYDLYQGHSVNLNKEFQKRIFESAVNKAGNFSELGRKLKINRKVISNILKNKYNPKIKTLIKVADYVDYPLEFINKEIVEVVGLKPKFPFILNNKEGAEIRAAFLSDGHVDKNPTYPSQYCAFEKELHERLINLCKIIFGEFNTKTYFGNKSYVTRFPSVIGDALELSGIPRGNKTLKNCYIPKDILVGNREIQTSYLRRVFDDEGDVCFDKYGKRAVRITRSAGIDNLSVDIVPEKWTRSSLPKDIKNNLLFGEQLLLLKLGIDARLYPEGAYKAKNGNLTAKWRIQIGQQDNLRKFAKLINFSLKEKREKLNKILNSYRQKKCPHGKGREKVLQFIKKIYKKKGFFRYGDLGKELVKKERSYDLAGYYLKFFLDKKIIKKNKQGIYVLNKA